MQLTRLEIFEKLQEIMLTIDDYDKEVIENSTEDTRLIDDLGLTSVGMLYLVIILEETFNIRFEGLTIDSIDTIGKVIDYIEGQL